MFSERPATDDLAMFKYETIGADIDDAPRVYNEDVNFGIFCFFTISSGKGLQPEKLIFLKFSISVVNTVRAIYFTIEVYII